MGKRRGKKLAKRGLTRDENGRIVKIDKNCTIKKKKFVLTRESLIPKTAAEHSSFANQATRERIRPKNVEMDSGDLHPGFIFMCNGKTKPECYRYRVFGLPLVKVDVVKTIKRGTHLFLYDFDLKLLYGTYQATSDGALDLEPIAFKEKFPAQVRFKISKECLPLHESSFRTAIRNNYQDGGKFKQELNNKQACSLISLFRPITLSMPTFAAHHRDVARADSYPSPTREGGFYPTAGQCFQEGLFSSTVESNQALPLLNMQSKQDVPYHPHYDRYEAEACGAFVQPLTEPRHFVQHHPDWYYPAAAHEPYMPEKPLSSSHDAYRRHGVTHSREMVPRDQADPYGSVYHLSQFLKERERDIVSHSDYIADTYSQNLPTLAPHRLGCCRHILQQHFMSYHQLTNCIIKRRPIRMRTGWILILVRCHCMEALMRQICQSILTCLLLELPATTEDVLFIQVMLPWLALFYCLTPVQTQCKIVKRHVYFPCQQLVFVPAYLGAGASFSPYTFTGIDLLINPVSTSTLLE